MNLRWMAVLMLVVLPWSAAGADTPRLVVIPDATSLELGEPLRVVLRAEHSAGDLYALSLAELEADFEARWEQRSRSPRRADRVWPRQEMTLRLYPRRTGRLELPALRLMDASSEALAIQVRAPQRLGLRLEAGLDAGQSYLRQPVLLWLEIVTNHDQFEARLPNISTREAHVQALGRSREQDPDGQYRLRYHWLVTPLYPGPMKLALPWLEIHDFQRQGVALRLPTPALDLMVRELPGYVPVDLPLAPVSARQQLSADATDRHEPLLWVLEVQGRDVSTRWLQRLLERSLSDIPGLRFHTPSIRQVERRDLPLGDRLFRVELPVTPLTGGEHVLPSLRLPYFDASTGRLAVTQLQGAGIRVRDPLRAGLGWVSTLLGGVLLGSLLLIPLLLVLRVLHARRALHRRLRQAHDAPALARALLAVEGSPPTLGQWLHYQRAGPALGAVVGELEAVCYGPPEVVDIQRLRARLREALTGHRLRLLTRSR
jgi:hypothetical protein